MPAKRGASTYAKKRATTVNKAKAARKAFKPKTQKYKSDHQSMICSTFIDGVGSILNATFNNGALANTSNVAAGAAFTIQATIALDPRNPILASNQHATYINLFNEWNCSAVYLDLLFSSQLRDCADQVFMLVERGNKDAITGEVAMCSDVNHRMYQLGNNTQKLSFKHIFSTSADKINKKSTSTATSDAPSSNDLVFLKILCKGKNHTAAAIEAGELQIKLRAKMYNKYRDMKVITAGLN